MFGQITQRFRTTFDGRLSVTLREQWQRSAASQWLNGLPPRDRTIVNVLAIVLAAAFVYSLVWSPVADWRERADMQYREAVAVSDWIAANEARLRTAGQAAPGRAGNTLLSTVANSAAMAGVQLTRVQPEAQDGVSVVIQDQEFNRVLLWLDELVSREQLAIRQLSIDSHASPGRVSARISLG
jgi:general secretion pathway protein M